MNICKVNTVQQTTIYFVCENKCLDQKEANPFERYGCGK